ncbi:MAG: hypothetical protein AAB538_00390, partial [Patescibacteria group bacterium]
PIEYANLPVTHGALAALSSGTDPHEQKAKEVKKLARDGGPTRPYEYSPEIAEIREALQGPNKAALLEKFEKAVQGVEANYKPPKFDVGTWINELEKGENGMITLHSTNCAVCAGHSAFGIILHVYLATRAGITLQDDLANIASDAEQRVRTQLQDTLVDGAVPDLAHTIEQGRGGKIGRIGTLVTAPANVKVGLQRDLLLALAERESNPEFVDPNQVQNRGGGAAAIGAPDQNGNWQHPQLNLGQPLKPLSEEDVYKKGLLEQAGVTNKLLHKQLNFLQDFLKLIKV